jgi:recombination protein RecR
MQHSPALVALIDALRTLPGVGPKSAQRMAFHLLQDARPAARGLAAALTGALERVGRCRQCRMLTEGELCSICANAQRDATLLCVVESPADVVAVEQSGGYRGRYFVLMGHLSPLDGIGPERSARASSGASCPQAACAVILATNPTVEGEATAHPVLQAGAPAQHRREPHRPRRPGRRQSSRYIDGGTLAHALAGRLTLG